MEDVLHFRLSDASTIIPDLYLQIRFRLIADKLINIDQGSLNGWPDNFDADPHPCIFDPTRILDCILDHIEEDLLYTGGISPDRVIAFTRDVGCDDNILLDSHFLHEYYYLF